jgi:hypothetical protein
MVISIPIIRTTLDEIFQKIADKVLIADAREKINGVLALLQRNLPYGPYALAGS